MSDRFDHTLEHTLKTKPDDGADDDTTTVRRIELITGPGPHSGRRRQWSTDDKARIVVESFTPGANVSEVARRNGLSPQQLFGWRREARELIGEDAGEVTDVAPSPPDVPSRTQGARAVGRGKRAERSASCEPAFAPVVIAASATSTPPTAPPPPPGGTPSGGRIEIAIGDAVVRICGQVELQLLTAVLRAVRRAS